MIKKTPSQSSQEWRERNPDYHHEYYKETASRVKILRYNAKNGASFPDDAIEKARGGQGGCCADCAKDIHGKREYLFHVGEVLQIVCVKCRRERRK